MTDTTRRRVTEGLAATALASDTKQPPGSVDGLTTQEVAALLENKDGGFVLTVRRRIEEGGRRGERILPLLVGLEILAPQMRPQELAEYILDIAKAYNQGENLTQEERDIIVRMVRSWRDPDTRVHLVDRLEVEAPRIADEVAAQEVSHNE